jgi:hypothetical protein
MPKIRRHNLPPTLLRHLLDRIRLREIPAEQLGLLVDWLDTEPEVPEGKWFKRFPGMFICGEGEWSRGDASDIDGNGREAERAGANESIGENISDRRSDPLRHRTFLTLVACQFVSISAFQSFSFSLRSLCFLLFDND